MISGKPCSEDVARRILALLRTCYLTRHVVRDTRDAIGPELLERLRVKLAAGPAADVTEAGGLPAAILFRCIQRRHPKQYSSIQAYLCLKVQSSAPIHQIGTKIGLN